MRPVPYFVTPDPSPSGFPLVHQAADNFWGKLARRTTGLPIPFRGGNRHQPPQPSGPRGTRLPRGTNPNRPSGNRAWGHTGTSDATRTPQHNGGTKDNGELQYATRKGAGGAGNGGSSAASQQKRGGSTSSAAVGHGERAPRRNGGWGSGTCGESGAHGHQTHTERSLRHMRVGGGQTQTELDQRGTGSAATGSVEERGLRGTVVEPMGEPDR